MEGQKEFQQVVTLGEYVEDEGFWCGCESPGEPEFYDNGQHSELSQHHFRCNQCGGILQIG